MGAPITCSCLHVIFRSFGIAIFLPETLMLQFGTRVMNTVYTFKNFYVYVVHDFMIIAYIHCVSKKFPPLGLNSL